MILFERDLFMLNDLFLEMINYFAGDAKRIQHLVKVHSFAKLIGELEHVEEKNMRILKAAAYVHDIGIKPAEKKYGSCGGKLQEQEGPAAAKEILERLGFDAVASSEMQSILPRAAAHFTLRSNIPRTKCIRQIPLGIYFVEKNPHLS